MDLERIKAEPVAIRKARRLRAQRERVTARALFAHYNLLGPALESAWLAGGDLALDLTFNSFQSPLNSLILDNNAVTAGTLGDFQMEQLAEKSLRLDHRTKQNQQLIIRQMQDFLSTNAQKSAFLATQTDRKNAARIIERGLKRGSSNENIARSLRRKFGGSLGRARSATIARTEVGIAGSRAEFEGAKNQKAKKKEWFAIRDNNLRDHHADVDGQQIGLRANFRPLGEKMKHPHDTSQGASAANIVNCRCSLGYFK